MRPAKIIGNIIKNSTLKEVEEQEELINVAVKSYMLGHDRGCARGVIICFIVYSIIIFIFRTAIYS